MCVQECVQVCVSVCVCRDGCHQDLHVEDTNRDINQHIQIHVSKAHVEMPTYQSANAESRVHRHDVQRDFSVGGDAKHSVVGRGRRQGAESDGVEVLGCPGRDAQLCNVMCRD